MRDFGDSGDDGSGRRRILFMAALVVGGLCAGAGLRHWLARPNARSVFPSAQRISRAVSYVSQDAPALFRKLLAGLNAELSRVLEDSSDTKLPQAPRAPAAPRVERAVMPSLRDLPNESPEQKAARLWQGGVLAMRQGDYRWAIQLFDGCLKSRPANERCRSGAAEARRRLTWNERSR
ncbi:MAG: hypothetical protein NTX64_09640 [Elusimicrobia bacterium]|nr:hypothetical protein [Elusimicrobiota bacterium]